MDPTGIIGITLAVYKDIFFLVKGIYKLASSAQYYQSQHQALLSDFFHEFLYLRVYYHVFFVNQGGSLVNNQQLNEEVTEAILELFRDIGDLFSEYKSLAIEEDVQYRRYNLASQEQNAIPLLEFSSSLDDLTRPSALAAVHHGSSHKTTTPLTELKTHFKEQPIYHLRGWKWSLFQKKQMMRVVSRFQEHNTRLRAWETLLLSSQFASASDLRDVASAIRCEPDTDNTAFVPHIRLRQVIQEAQDEQHGKLEHARSLTPVQLELRETPSSQRTWIEYKVYRHVEDHERVVGQRNNHLLPYAHTTRLRYDPKEQVDELARLLLEAGSYNFHTLPFHGYQHEPDESRFAFFFKYPADATSLAPSNLNQLLQPTTSINKVSLGPRFEIARIVSDALGAFHADGWVHKSIMSQSIIFFKDDDGIPEYSKPYLTGFEVSRREFEETLNTFDDDPDKNLYRHPARQGPPSAYFNRVHDVYALGVVLLEIGLWQTVSEIQRRFLERRDRGYVLSPEGLQEAFLRTAKGRLGHLMGERYMQAVVTCLSCELDPYLGQDSFGLMFRRQVIDKVDPRGLMDQESRTW